MTADAPVFCISSPTVEVYDYIEVIAAMRVEASANPFTDVEFSGEFGPTGGHPVHVEGFCDCPNGNLFRIRFMPSQPGDHAFTVRLRHAGKEHEYSGAFEATYSNRKGPLRVDPATPLHFLWEGTNEHCFWNGTTCYFLLGWQDDRIIMRAIDRLHDLKINRMRVAINGRTQSGERWGEPRVRPSSSFQFCLDPWMSSDPSNIESPGIDVSRFNVLFWRRLENALRHAREKDMIFDIIFYVDGQDPGVDPFGKAGMGRPDEQRYYRYAIARLAAFSNITWDITNEWRNFRTAEWVNQMGTLIKSVDPYLHLSSCHGHATFEFGASKWCDFVMYQRWDESGGYDFLVQAQEEQEDTGRPMPIVNEEYGYEDHYPQGWGEARTWPARTADNRRRLAWEIAMAGCYQTTGERANGGTGPGSSDTGGGWINGRGDESMTMLHGYRHLVDFFTSFPWWRLSASPDNVSDGLARVRAEPGKRYVVYLPAGDGTVTIAVKPGKYVVRWYNCRSGEWMRLGELSLAEWTLPEAPDAGDWAMLIEAV